MFALIGAGAGIRGLGLAGNLAAYTGMVVGTGAGGLAGVMGGGSVASCHATGETVGSERASSSLGGLVGRMDGGSIAGSHATGDVGAAGDSDGNYVGGLVGWHSGGSIIASWASGDVDGGAGIEDRVGGLVGVGDALVASSHATGDVSGGEGNRDYVGGLVGWQFRGTIIASHATGDATGGAGVSDAVGGLVGSITHFRGSIVSSHATGDTDGGTGGEDDVGGLVGRLFDGAITASYATGDATGGAGIEDRVGGLVGFQDASTITASYATGAADGGTGTGDNVGGLVGLSEQIGGAITASYATGAADGGTGTGDSAGSLVGSKGVSATATASWGFGAADGETAGFAGSEDRPAGAITAAALTGAPDGTALTNAPATWDAAANGTLGAWDYGGQLRPPALRFADYDGTGAGFHCAGAASAPGGAIIVPTCGALLPGQRALAPPLSATVRSAGPGALRLSWVADPSATHYRVWRGATAMRADAEEVSPPGGVAATTFTDVGLEGEAAYHYWVQSCTADDCTMGEASASGTAPGAGSPPILEPVAMPGETPLYSYEIGRAHPAERRIRFANSGGAITGCSAADEDLPRGMSIDTGTCEISGAPTRRSERTTSHTVTATGAMGSDAVEIEIETRHLSPPDLGGLTAGALSLGAGQRLGLPIALPNAGGQPTTCRALSDDDHSADLESLNLRFNRTADGRSCELGLDDLSRGVGASAAKSLRLEASNSIGSSRAALSLNVGEGAGPSSLAVTGTSSNFTLSANSAINPIAFTRAGAGLCAAAGPDGGPLPAGLLVDQATCRISGTPTQVSPETVYTVTLARGLASASDDITITVTDAAPALEPTAAAALTQGRPDGLPAIVAATAGVPTACTAASTAAAQGSLADHNLFLYATPPAAPSAASTARAPPPPSTAAPTPSPTRSAPATAPAPPRWPAPSPSPSPRACRLWSMAGATAPAPSARPAACTAGAEGGPASASATRPPQL